MRNVLITGLGHHQGIGYATASKLASRGDNILGTRWSEYDHARDFSQNTSVSWPTIDADLNNTNSPSRIFEFAESKAGRIDILILNHAFCQPDNIENFTPELLDSHFSVNVRGSLLLCQEFVKRNQSGWGRIVFLTSGQSLHAMPNELSYAASKGAIESISLSLASTLADQGITVNSIDPGITDTGWIAPDNLALWSKDSPRGRVGLPTDAANLIAFLTSEEGGWVTGQLIRSRGAI